MKSHYEGARILCAVALAHVSRPDAPGRPQLRDLLEEIVVNVPEERETGRELVDVETPCYSPLHIRESVGQRERELLSSRGARLPDMVAGDRNGIPLRDVLGGPCEAIDDQPERRLDREAPGMLRHVLLEDVVLNRPPECSRIHALLLGRGNVEAVQNHGRPVDRHRGGDLVERNAVEQQLHVSQAGDRYATLPYLSLGSRVVRVIAHERREIEGDRKSRLPVREEKLVTLVRVACASEAGELTHRPQLAAIPGGMNSPCVGIDAGRAEIYRVFM